MFSGLDSLPIPPRAFFTLFVELTFFFSSWSNGFMV